MVECASTPNGEHAVLRAQVWRGESGFDRLRPSWLAAVARMHRPSLFITPDFLQLSWQHLREAGDEPWFVVVHDGGELAGLLPLVLRRDPRSRIFRKVLIHMGQLAGDRPGIVHTVAADRVWQAALAALAEQRAHWHAMDLRELDETAWPVRSATWQAAPAHASLQSQVLPSTHAGYLRIEGDWDSYLASRSRNTRQGYRRQERRLQETFPDLRIDVVDAPDAVDQALDRYFALDAMSWKREAGVEFWSRPGEQDCLRALVRHLACTGRASVWLLAAGTTDMAGLVRFRQGSVVYERCSTYDPAFARFGPSTYLCMEAVRHLFGSDCDESDVLGMTEPLAERPAIQAWYPLQRRTLRLLTLSPPWWWRPVLVVRSWWASRCAQSDATLVPSVDPLAELERVAERLHQAVGPQDPDWGASAQVHEAPRQDGVTAPSASRERETESA